MAHLSGVYTTPIRVLDFRRLPTSRLPAPLKGNNFQIIFAVFLTISGQGPDSVTVADWRINLSPFLKLKNAISTGKPAIIPEYVALLAKPVHLTRKP